MSKNKNKKHDGHAESKPVPNKGELTVGDYVMIKPNGLLARETYGASVGLLCEIVPASETNADIQGKILFAGQLITLNLDLVQLRNY